MYATQVIRKIMEDQSVKPSTLASRLNIKNNVLSERLGQKNISILKLNEMLRVLDYKIVIMPRDMKIREGCYEVDNGDD